MGKIFSMTLLNTIEIGIANQVPMLKQALTEDFGLDGVYMPSTDLERCRVQAILDLVEEWVES